MSKNWYKLCPVCDQGRLFVMKRQDDGNLFLLCEECESAWNMPEEIDDKSKNFSIDGISFTYANETDIERTGWIRYSMTKTDS